MKKGLTDLQLVNNIYSISKSFAQIYDCKPQKKEFIFDALQKFNGNFFYTFDKDAVFFSKTKFNYVAVQFEAVAYYGKWYVNIIENEI